MEFRLTSSGICGGQSGTRAVFHTALKFSLRIPFHVQYPPPHVCVCMVYCLIKASRKTDLPNGYIPIVSMCTKYRVFRKQPHNGIANVTVWRVLRKRLHLNAYKPRTMDNLYAFKCKRFRNIRCFLQHHDSSEHCTYPLNKCIQVFKLKSSF
jgi:hypothetical protein